MKKLLILSVVFIALSYFTISNAQAQCAMCSLTAEASVKNGNKQGEKLNKGIFVLLSAPYLAVGVVGFVWYKRYRRKKETEEPESFF